MAPADADHRGPDSRLVLASTSAYRRSLLERLGIPFRCRAPLCDEEVMQRESSDLEPRRLAEKLAVAKASSLSREEAGCTIIGCDQLVSFGGRIFGKPGTADRAVDQLLSMSGQTHELITAVAVIRGAEMIRHTDITRLRMRSLSPEAIERYVRADRALDCAGSYKLESRGIVLFDRIESEDHSAVTGLPLIALVTILRDLGFPIP
jgi:septum formation protein